MTDIESNPDATSTKNGNRVGRQKPDAKKHDPAGGSRGWLLGCYVVAVCTFLLAPLLTAGAMAFSSGDSNKFPPTGFGLHWFGNALDNDLFIQGTWLSLQVAFQATILATVVGTCSALLLRQWGSRRGMAGIDAFIMSPMVLPMVVTGLALLQTTQRIPGLDSRVALVAGHAVVISPYVTRLVAASLAYVPSSLEKTSVSLGRSPLATLFEVTLRLSLSGIISGTSMAFLLSFDNVAISLFLTNGDTLPLALLAHVQYYADPSVAAISVLLLIVPTIVLVINSLLNRKRAAGRTRLIL